MFTGVFTALITPFRNGAIDYDALARIIEMQIEGGVDGLVPMGTTGESPTIAFEEHKEFIKKVVRLVNRRVPVVAGTGANSTKEAVYLSQDAEQSGVDALLQVCPYYNRPTQKGLIAHFESIAGSVKIPLVLYNIPGRTGVNFEPESLRELLNRTDNVKAMKEASGDITQMMRIMELCGDRIDLLSGDDNMLLPLLAIGGKGVISVLSNLVPADVRAVVTAYEKGDLIKARDFFFRILPLCRAMFYETNPGPIKTAMSMMGYCSAELRLPLSPLTDENSGKLRQALKNYGLLK